MDHNRTTQNANGVPGNLNQNFNVQDNQFQPQNFLGNYAGQYNPMQSYLDSFRNFNPSYNPNQNQYVPPQIPQQQIPVPSHMNVLSHGAHPQQMLNQLMQHNNPPPYAHLSIAASMPVVPGHIQNVTRTHEMPNVEHHLFAQQNLQSSSFEPYQNGYEERYRQRNEKHGQQIGQDQHVQPVQIVQPIQQVQQVQLVRTENGAPQNVKLKREKRGPPDTSEEEERDREKRLKEDLEKKMEEEELQRFANDKRREADNAAKHRSGIESKHTKIVQPLTLAGTSLPPTFLDLIPLPYEGLSNSTSRSVCDLSKNGHLLDDFNPSILPSICKKLGSVNVDDINTRMAKLRPSEKENNDLFFDQLPKLIKEVVTFNNSALDVDSHNDMQLLENEDLMMQQDITSAGPSQVLIQQSEEYHRLGNTQSIPETIESSSRMEEMEKRVDDGEASAPIMIEKRRQMMSVGKAPKAGSSNNHRKKRDMVEHLYDSLTDNFVPSGGRRGRRKNHEKEDEEEELRRDLKLIAEMEAREKADEGVKGHNEDEDIDEARFFERKAKKRKREEREERPPTPTDVISARDAEWNERLRMKMEMNKKRKTGEDGADWNTDALAENDSFVRFNTLLDNVFDQVENIDLTTIMKKSKSTSKGDINSSDDEDDEVDPELLIDKHILDELRREGSKLKHWKKLHKVTPDRLLKIISLLDRNMRNVVSSDNMRFLVQYFDEDNEEEDPSYKEIIEERLIKAVDAASIAMIIMTSHKMHKQVIIEDTIERAVALSKHYLNHVIFPASDSLFKANHGKKRNKESTDEPKRKRRAIATNNRSAAVQMIYLRVAELFGCFSELVRLENIPESCIHNMSSMSISSFFISNVGELQMQSMKLASNIFSRMDNQTRFSIINDLLSSLHRTPSSNVKNINNGYLLGNDQWISNTTALVMQLIQSVIKMPRLKKTDESEETEKFLMNQDAIVRDSFTQASKITSLFLNGFLSRCSQKGSKLDGEEDYRSLFSQFLQEVLMALYQPEWPVADMILTTLGPLLVNKFRCKTTDIAIRQASIDYLGLITARLRRDMKSVVDDRIDLVVKTLFFDEDEDGLYGSVEDVDISKLTHTDKIKKLEQALIDFIVERKGDSDVSVEYSVLFYAGEWYMQADEDVEMARSSYKRDLACGDLTEKHKRKLEERNNRLIKRGKLMKEFLMRLVDKKHMRKRLEFVRNKGSVLLESDALWTVKYLAKSREFSHSFEIYLSHIVCGAGRETIVNLRTRALKCLSMIIEADHEVLIMEEVRKAVHQRMIDPHAQVREAAVDLLGKFLLVDESFVAQYYTMLIDRIMDSGVSVRKRVIRIMREICEKFPNFQEIPKMLSKVVRRVIDEDGVKKLVQDTFLSLWFNPVDDKITPKLLNTKVMVMASVVQDCIKDRTVEFLETLMHAILKSGDKSVLFASKQIVDNLVDSILHLETKMANECIRLTEGEEKLDEIKAASIQKKHQDRQLACLTTLAIFSKVKPELLVKHAETLQPYLTSSSTNSKSAGETAVMIEVIGMLERVIPLMNHPSDSFLAQVDENLTNMASKANMRLVVSAVACSSAIWHRFKRYKPKLVEKFLSFFGLLDNIRRKDERDKNFKMDAKTISLLQRATFTIGVLCRYLDFDQFLNKKDDTAENSEEGSTKEVKRVIRDRVFSVLEYFSRSDIFDIKQKALISIGHFCSQYSEYLTRDELKHMYLEVLNSCNNNILPLKIQVLKNLEMFLTNEEQKLAKLNEEWDTNKDNENLKDMELSGSGLSSTVIQIYWTSVLKSYMNANLDVRFAAAQVTWLTMSQGLVTPGAAMGTIIAMTSDPNEQIRNKMDNLLKEVESKYNGMVEGHAFRGIRNAFILHNIIRQAASKEEQSNDINVNIVRGFRYSDFTTSVSSKKSYLTLPKMSNDGIAWLGGLYQGLRANRQHRRSFLNTCLRVFSEDSREKVKLEEWVFIADNIAMFPYQMMDEPLYVIRQIDKQVAQSGQTIMNQLKENLLPLPSYENVDDEDVLFDTQNILRRFPENKDNLYELMEACQSCFILLYIRNFLMKLYGFTETKVQEYLPSEAAKVYEKAVSRRNISIFCPATALVEMNPNTILERNTIKGDQDLADKISRFRKMLLSLDRGDDESGDELQPLAIANNDDDDDTMEDDDSVSVSSAVP